MICDFFIYQDYILKREKITSNGYSRRKKCRTVIIE